MSAAHREPSGRRRIARVAGGGSLALALLLGPALAGTAFAAPAPPDATVSLPDLLTQLQTLYQHAEQATESYDKAKERVGAERKRANRLNGELATAKHSLSDARATAGAIARQQYQNGAIDPYLNLLLAKDPQDLFAQNHVLAQTAGSQQQLVTRLRKDEKRVSTLRAAARRALGKATTAEKQQRRAKKRVKARLAQAETLVEGLTGAQRAELRTLETKGADAAQKAFLAAGKLGTGATDRAPSAVGARAVDFAFGQLGKPYVWGAQGPKSYDCSGLTSQAWAAAGVTIPRTSEDQWAHLPHVPLDLLRPGDLVIYFSKASHVALYIGGGMVIEAPHPGGVVEVAPIAVDPVLGAVRPDSDESPLRSYRPPAAAEKATKAAHDG
jgi:cell wall-associated NlpC family hydrolase